MEKTKNINVRKEKEQRKQERLCCNPNQRFCDRRMCVLCRARVFTTWMRMGPGSLGRCSPLALVTVTPTLWSTAASEKTWHRRTRTIWPGGPSFTPRTGTRIPEGWSTVSLHTETSSLFWNNYFMWFTSWIQNSFLIWKLESGSNFVKSLNS